MLTRARSYNDTLQHLDVEPPNNAPQWCYVQDHVNADVAYDTDIGYDSSIYDEYIHDIDVTMEENRQQEWIVPERGYMIVYVGEI